MCCKYVVKYNFTCCTYTVYLVKYFNFAGIAGLHFFAWPKIKFKEKYISRIRRYNINTLNVLTHK